MNLSDQDQNLNNHQHKPITQAGDPTNSYWKTSPAQTIVNRRPANGCPMQSNQTRGLPLAQAVSQPEQTNYAAHIPSHSGDLFDPGHIFQLDQPILRRTNSYPTTTQSYPIHNNQPHSHQCSPSTFLDLGSGTIEHRTFESIFGSNEDSCTTSSSQNNEGSEYLYGITGTLFPTTHVTTNQPMMGQVGAHHRHPIAESDEILLEFQTANDRLQKHSRRAEYHQMGRVNGEMATGTGDVIMQGNLGIYVEREMLQPQCGRHELNDYANNNLVYGGAQDMDDGADYLPYYRMNSVNNNINNNNVDTSLYETRMDCALEPSAGCALFVNRS